MIEIQIWPNYVLIDGQRVERKMHVSVSTWLDFWEHVVRKHPQVV